MSTGNHEQAQIDEKDILPTMILIETMHRGTTFWCKDYSRDKEGNGRVMLCAALAKPNTDRSMMVWTLLHAAGWLRQAKWVAERAQFAHLLSSAKVIRVKKIGCDY